MLFNVLWLNINELHQVSILKRTRHDLSFKKTQTGANH